MSVVTQTDAVAWNELHTPDREKAEAFYNTLFGWTTTPVEMGPDYTYHLLNRAGSGEMFAGSHQQGPEEGNVPPHWNVILSANDVDDAVARATELGATLVMGPHDIPGTGRYAFIMDPQGAHVGLLKYQGGDEPPARRDGPGNIVWHELVTGDPEASSNFYAAIFGYDVKQEPMGDVTTTVFKHNDQLFADVLPKPVPEAPDAWVFYIEVQDAQATVDLALASGGSVVSPPMPFPEVGTIGWLADPTGAVFGILEPIQSSAS